MKEGKVYGGFGGWRGKKKWSSHILISKKKYSFKKGKGKILC